MSSGIIFDPNVPQNPTDSFAFSQESLLDNFISMDFSFEQNHVPLTAASGAGNHTVIELLQQMGAQQTDISTISLYAKNVKGQTDQLFLRYQGNGPEVQISNYQIYSLPQIGSQVQYFTFLPGRIIVYFGTFSPGSFFNQNPELNRILLQPALAFNILYAGIYPMGTNPGYKLAVILPAISGGPYPFITANTGLFGAPFPFPTNYSYVVIGNV